MPVNGNFITAIGNVLITSLRISEPGAQVLLGKVLEIVEAGEVQMIYSWYVFLLLGFFEMFFHVGKRFDVSKFVHSESVLGIEGVVVHGGNGKTGIV